MTELAEVGTDAGYGRRPVRAGRRIALALAMLALGSGAAMAHDPELIEVESAKSIEQAAAAIREGLEANKMMIVRQIHFHEMLGMVGIESERMLTFETFHPRFGKAIYENDKSAFLEPPLRIHLRETDAGALVRYRLPSSVFAPYNGLGAIGADLDAIFADVVRRLGE